MVNVSALNRKLLRDFWGMRGQALAIAMVIAGGVATWVISFSVVDSLESTQQSFYREYRFADVFASVKRAPENLARRIAAMPGVNVVETRTTGFGTVELPGFRAPITAETISIPDQGQPILNRLYLRSGRLPQGDKEALVSEPFAVAQNLRLGDVITATINGLRQRLRITGLALSPEFIYQIGPGSLFPDYKRFAIIWMRHKPLAAIWDMESAFNNVVLSLGKGANEEDVIDRLDRLLKPYGGIGAYGRKDQLSNEFLSQELKELRGSATVIPFIFLGVAAFLLSVVIGRIIEQQRDQVAILKAFGYTNRQVGQHYIGLVMLTVSLGCVVGVGLGAWLGHSLSGFYSRFFRFPFLDYVLTARVIAGGIGVAAAAALFGTLRAIGRAVSLPPAEAMRPEPPASYRPTIIERLGAQRFFDQPTRMIIRHLERRPIKSLFSILGIAMAGAILMVGSFQGDALDYMIDVQLNLAQRQDLTVAFTDPVERRALFELEQIPGVILAEPFRSVPVRLHHGHRTYRTSIQAYENGGELYRTLNDKLQPITIPTGGLLLTEYLGHQLDVKPGDRITVEVLEGAEPVREVPVAGLVREFIGVSGYMEIGALNHLLQEGNLISGAHLAIDSNRRDAILKALEERPRVAGVTERQAAIDSFYETVGETLIIFAFFNVLLAGTIAFGVVYNSARINLSEHSRELASLRVLGFTRGEISYILLGELAALTLAAIPLGFLIGYGFCRLISEGLTTELYRVPLILEPSTFGFSATTVLAAAIISGAIMHYRLYRLDLIGVLKTRE